MNPRMNDDPCLATGSTGRLAALLVTMGACVGIMLAASALSGAKHAARTWTAAPAVESAWVGALPGIEAATTAAVVVLLLWGLRVRLFASPMQPPTAAVSHFEIPVAVARTLRIRSLNRGGRHGP